MASIFPAKVAWHLSADASSCGPLIGEEHATADSMSEKRLATFMHGRHCARRAMEEWGLGDSEIPIGPGRAPVWPRGFIGSISHTDELAVAAVASQRDFVGLGIDIEQPGCMEAGVAAMVCRAEEQAMLKRLGPPEIGARLVFSAKESIYKCIWPLHRQFVDFQQIGLRFDIGSREFVIATALALPTAPVRSLRGRYVATERLIATAVFLDSGAWSAAEDPD